jgi:hypothetical protein
MLVARFEDAVFQGTDSHMRSPITLLIIAICALIATACGGVSNEQLDDSRQRQAEEVLAEGGVPPAGYEEEATEEQTAKEDAGTEPSDSGTTEGIDEEENAKVDKEEEADSAEGAINADSRGLFSDTCASCHTLADADASGTVGPNLDDLDLTAEEVAAQIENGGGAMPGGLLTGADAEAVAAYVAAAAGK